MFSPGRIASRSRHRHTSLTFTDITSNIRIPILLGKVERKMDPRLELVFKTNSAIHLKRRTDHPQFYQDFPANSPLPTKQCFSIWLRRQHIWMVATTMLSNRRDSTFSGIVQSSGWHGITKTKSCDLRYHNHWAIFRPSSIHKNTEFLMVPLLGYFSPSWTPTLHSSRLSGFPTRELRGLVVFAIPQQATFNEALGQRWNPSYSKLRVPDSLLP